MAMFSNILNNGRGRAGMGATTMFFLPWYLQDTNTIAEQVHRHLDSKQIWFLSTLFSVLFLLLEGSWHIVGAHNYLLNKHGRRNKKSLEGSDKF